MFTGSCRTHHGTVVPEDPYLISPHLTSSHLISCLRIKQKKNSRANNSCRPSLPFPSLPAPHLTSCRWLVMIGLRPTCGSSYKNLILLVWCSSPMRKSVMIRLRRNFSRRSFSGHAESIGAGWGWGRAGRVRQGRAGDFGEDERENRRCHG